MKSGNLRFFTVLALTLAVLASCNSGGAGSPRYTVGGSVAGLSSAGLVLQNNGSDDLAVSADGAFTFATGLVDGAAYSVTIAAQPSGQTCSISGNTGAIAGASVTNVSLVCAVNTFTVGGTVSGLVGTVVLQNNGADDLSVSANGIFTFATEIADGASYDVTVKTPPAGRSCTASSNIGTVSGANVTNVSVDCADKWTGTKQLGVSGAYTGAKSAARDASGNVYVAGLTSGGLDGNTLTGTMDFFLTMYDSLGNKVRTQQLGVSGVYTGATGISADANGNVYVAGLTYGGLDGNTLMGAMDFFLTMYDSSGNKVRTKQLGVSWADTGANGVAVDASGNVYVAGFTSGGLDGNTLMGQQDFFLTMFDASGNKVRTQQLGVAGAYTDATSVAVDASGNVYVAGTTSGGLDGNTLTGTRDFFFTMYDSAGNKVRTKQLGVAGAYTGAKSVAVDAGGNVYVAGITYGGLDGNTLTGTQDYFLTMYDSAGRKVRTKQLGVAGVSTCANGAAVDESGNVYVAGFTYGGLDGNTLTGTQDFFLTMYDVAGNKVRTKQLGVAGVFTVANGIALDASRNVYVAGTTSGGLDGNTLTGTQDFFITKYDPSGNKQ